MARTSKAARQQSDREVAQVFLEKVTELAETKLATTGGLSIEHHIHYDKEEGLKTSLKEPDENDLRSYLVTFRQFISEGEPVFIGRIYNLCARRLTDDELKRYAADARQHWLIAQKHNGMKLIVNEHEYAASEVCDWFINGQHFHSDPDYRAKLKAMANFPLDREIFRFHFLNFVVEASRHILYLHGLILYAQREGKISLDDAQQHDDGHANTVNIP